MAAPPFMGEFSVRLALVLIASLALASGSALASQQVPYKGRTITVGDSPAAGECLIQLRKAIDMVEGLPSHLRSLGGEVKALRCDPPATTGNEAYDSVVGVYVINNTNGGRNYIDFRRNPAFLSPARYALSLVGNGIYASQPALPTDNKGASRQHLECKILLTELDTIRALQLDPRMIDGYSKEINQRGCRGK